MKLVNLAIVVVVALMVAVAVLLVASLVPQPPQQPRVANPGGLPIPPWALRFGNENAPVVLVEFYDLLCPWCAYAHVELGPLIKEMVEEGKLYYILVDFPVHGEYVWPLHQRLHCAYRELGSSATLELVDRLYYVWYLATCEGTIRLPICKNTISPNEAVVNMSKTLQPYVCRFNVTVAQALGVLDAFKKVGIKIGGTPTFIVYRNGTLTVVEGARVDMIRQLLSG